MPQLTVILTGEVALGRSGWRLEPRILILFLTLGIVPPVVGHLILVSGARAVYLEQTGIQLSQRASDVQRELGNLIETAVLQVSNLANNPAIRESLTGPELSSYEADQFEQEIQRIETVWPRLGPDDPEFRAVLENPVSRLLRQLGVITPTFRKILLTDRYGRLVFATNKTSDYYQADETWWQRAALQGQGARFISDIVFDESANTYGMEIAEPVRDRETQEVIGIVKAILDSAALFASLEAANEGIADQTSLVRTDGTMIWSPDARTRNDFADEMSAIIGLNRQSAVAPARDGQEMLLGIPSFGLKDRIPELDWYVLINSPMSNVLLPFENLNGRFLYIVLATIIVVIVLAFVFTHIVSRPAVDVDPHFERLGSRS